MAEHDPQRRVAQYRLDRLLEQERSEAGGRSPQERASPADAPADAPSGRAPAQEPSREPADPPRPSTMAARGAFADELVRQAIARGEFDDLPLAGKPIPGLSGRYDPDWWLKAFIEREQITGVLPEALQLRKDDAVLDARLDEEHHEDRVREAVQEFNARVVEARRQLLGGPPVVTPTRDVDAEVARWHERRARRAEAARRAAQEVAPAHPPTGARTRWWARAAGWARRG